MHFTFGYQREVQVEIERKTSKIFLFGIALLVVLLFLFLAFETIDEKNLSPSASFNVASCSAKGETQTDVGDRVKIEMHMRSFELK